MLTILSDWWSEARRRRRERALVAQLLTLNDHHLADIGLRRDQLQPDGIRALDQPPATRRVSERPARRPAAIRPSLQGCG